MVQTKPLNYFKEYRLEFAELNKPPRKRPLGGESFTMEDGTNMAQAKALRRIFLDQSSSIVRPFLLIKSIGES